MTLKSPKLTRLLSGSAAFICLTMYMNCTIFLFSCKKISLSSNLYKESANSSSLLDNLPANQQRAMYPLLTASDRCAAWKSHLNYALGLPNKFTEQQINYLNELRNVLTPKLFELKPSSSGMATINSYKQLAQQLFDKPTARFLFGSLGNVKDFQVTAKDGQDGTSDQLGGSTSCNCSTASDYCFGFSDCVNNNEECKVSDKAGCGFLWRYICDGLCQ